MRFDRSRLSSKFSIILVLLGAISIFSSCDATGQEQGSAISVTTDVDTYVKTESSVDAITLTTAEQSEPSEADSPEVSSQDVVEYVRDQYGNIISEITIAQDGTPVINDRGFYKGLYTYDSDGNILREEYFDTSEVPVNTTEGYASVVYSYYKDSNGQFHIQAEDRFAADGTRAVIPGDFSYRRDEWDGDRIISTSFYGANDMLTCSVDGFAQLLYEYQDRYASLIITKRYFNEDNSPVIGPEGGAVIVSEYTSKVFSINTFSALFEDITRDDLPVENVEEKNKLAGSDFNIEINKNMNPELYLAHKLISRSIYGLENEQVEGPDGWHMIENTLESNGELLHTDYLDSEGQTVLCSDGYASVDYMYDEVGRVTKAKYFDQEEKLLKFNTRPAIITFDYSESRYLPQFSGLGLPSVNLSSIADYYMIRREQDRNGRTLKKIYLNNRQKPVLCTEGYAFQINTRNDQGKVIQSEYLDKEEKPVNTINGYSIVSYSYDDEGNKESESYFDSEKNPAWCNGGYHKIVFTYDSHRRCTEEHLFNIYDKPAIHTDGRYSSLVRAYDQNGRVISIKYYGISGEPGLYQGCFTEEHHRYDENGFETEVSYTDLNNSPASCRDGYAKKLTRYNDLGSITEETFFDKDGKPVNTIRGYASVSYKYDQAGNILSLHYYDANHKNVRSSITSYAYYVMERDEEGQLTSLVYYDDSGNPVNGSEGYASCHLSYTKSGRVSEEYYRDQDGKPVATKEGYSRRTLESEDEKEGTYVMRVTDESDSATRDYEYILIKYDDQNRAIEHRYYVGNNHPVNGPDGCFMTISIYSTNFDMVRVFYFDSMEQQIAVNGVYGVQREYIPNGRLEKETWLGKNGKPVRNKDGYAILQYDYDLNNLEPVEKEYRYYQDVNGNPVEAFDGSYGISISRYLKTNVCEKMYLGADGEPVNATGGFALYRSEEDENGNVIRESYFDANGARTEGPEGYSTVEREYDTENRIVSERYLDHFNKLTNNVEGIAGWNGSYDASGRLVIDRQYDKDLNQIE